MDERQLDARDLVCPLPVLKARKALQDMPPGAVLEVLATDPAAPIDFAVFCETNGHLLSTTTVDEVIVFRIEKAR
ncbi:MAG: sulfurtransferase TusA family protein [Inquilinus sp.]|nr:sulfurtransferase TusA family protein [Inquilinus sp.]